MLEITWPKKVAGRSLYYDADYAAAAAAAVAAVNHTCCDSILDGSKVFATGKIYLIASRFYVLAVGNLTISKIR